MQYATLWADAVLSEACALVLLRAAGALTRMALDQLVNAPFFIASMMAILQVIDVSEARGCNLQAAAPCLVEWLSALLLHCCVMSCGTGVAASSCTLQ
jgi:hypothetical protein